MGEVTRIRTLTPQDREAIEQFKILGKELKYLGYDKQRLINALRKKYNNRTRQIFWKDAMRELEQ